MQAEATSHAGKVRDSRQALEEAASRASRTTQVGYMPPRTFLRLPAPASENPASFIALRLRLTM